MALLQSSKRTVFISHFPLANLERGPGAALIPSSGRSGVRSKTRSKSRMPQVLNITMLYSLGNKTRKTRQHLKDDEILVQKDGVLIFSQDKEFSNIKEGVYPVCERKEIFYKIHY
jgi:hypothetical protein